MRMRAVDTAALQKDTGQRERMCNVRKLLFPTNAIYNSAPQSGSSPSSIHKLPKLKTAQGPSTKMMS